MQPSGVPSRYATFPHWWWYPRCIWQPRAFTSKRTSSGAGLSWSSHRKSTARDHVVKRYFAHTISRAENCNLSRTICYLNLRPSPCSSGRNAQATAPAVQYEDSERQQYTTFICQAVQQLGIQLSTVAVTFITPHRWCSPTRFQVSLSYLIGLQDVESIPN